MCGFQVGGDLSGAFVDVLGERLAGIIQLFERIQHPRPATAEVRDLGFQGCDMRFVFTEVSIVQPDEQRLKTLPAMGTEDLPIEEVVQPRDERLFTDPHDRGMPFRQVRAFRAADVVQPPPIVLAEHPAFAVGTGDVGPQDARVFGVFGIGSAGRLRDRLRTSATCCASTKVLTLTRFGWVGSLDHTHASGGLCLPPVEEVAFRFHTM
nr:hypothetical protein [Actinomadura mexicana]